MAHLISAADLSRFEGWLAYRSIYLPSMSYSLPSASPDASSPPSKQPIRHSCRNGFQPEHAARGCIRPNIHRRSRPAAFVCRTRLPKTSALLQHIRQNRSPRTNDVDRTPVDASYSGVGCHPRRTLEALTSRSRPLVTFST
jgi:hypothetical protein